MLNINRTKNIKKIEVVLMVLFFGVCFSVFGQTGGSYDLAWSTIDDGGGVSSGGTYIVRGTIGQPDVVYSAGVDYELFGGFWPPEPLCTVDFEDFARFAEQWLRDRGKLVADLDGDEDVDLEDLRMFVDEWLYCCPYGWPLR